MCFPNWEVFFILLFFLKNIFKISDYNSCSHSCGGGIRTRRIRCTQIVSRNGGTNSTLILPDFQCNGDKPKDQEPCGLVDCSPIWKVTLYQKKNL